MQDTDKAKPDVVRGDAVGVIRQVRKGELAFELDQEIEALVQAVKETGKGGDITLKLTVKPLKAGSKTLDVGGTVKSKLPVKPHDASIFYATADNKLVRNDPDQMRFPGVDDE